VSDLLYLDYIALNFFEMTWDFLVVICSKNTVPQKNLHFLDNYFIVYNFFVLCETKYGELYIENSIIMQRPPHVFVS
jgi:hypothetical protein